MNWEERHIQERLTIMGNIIPSLFQNNNNNNANNNVGGNTGRRRGEDWPSLSVTWEDFQIQRESPYSEEDESSNLTNGLSFYGVVIPDSILEHVLSWVNPEDVLNCNLVCRRWKDIIIRKSYWKKWYDRQGLDWGSVPQHVKSKPQSWIVFHAQVRHQVFTKNYINNHSGMVDNPAHRRYQGWTVHSNGGDGWSLENPPRGCDPLPADPFYNNSTSAWTTSYANCLKWTSVDLWSCGLTPPVLETMMPFSITCSQMYTSRFDCGGIFIWMLRVLDKDEEMIQNHPEIFRLPAQREWHSAEHVFNFPEIHKDKIREMRYVIFCHEGKDMQYWAGHYGMKFSRSCVRISLDERSEAENSLETARTEANEESELPSSDDEEGAIPGSVRRRKVNQSEDE